MAWWVLILEKIDIGDKVYTPGRGVEGLRKKLFTILEIDSSKIIIGSGASKIPLEKKCFDAVENAFSNNTLLWLRVAALHDNEPFENSVDKLIRDETGSQLARGNYICSILEHCGLVRYAMQGNKKGIELIRLSGD
jgi:hypothetical protein